VAASSARGEVWTFRSLRHRACLRWEKCVRKNGEQMVSAWPIPFA